MTPEFFSRSSLNSKLKNQAIYLPRKKGHPTLFHSTGTLRIAPSITVTSNTHHHMHNNSSHLHFCQSNVYLHMFHIYTFFQRICLLLGDDFHAQALFEPSATYPTSTVVPQLSGNIEERQMHNRQLFLYRGL